MAGIGTLPIRETPISVIDFETTGIYPKRDRVVEVTVVRIDPDKEPVVAFDSLVNPGRKVAASEIHGITDEDVRDAPHFGDIAGDILDAVRGSVLSAYNVYFDVKFLKEELKRLGVSFDSPHFCLMYMWPLLGLGKKSPLSEACNQVGIEVGRSHTSLDDAKAGAGLWKYYQDILIGKRVNNFLDLASLGSYKFLESFHNDPAPGPEQFDLLPSRKAFSRSNSASISEPSSEQLAIRAYWDVIKEVVADLQVTDDEAEYAAEQRRTLGLTKEQIRFLHARAFASAISQFIDDQHLDDIEARKLRKLRTALSRMGWAPGD